MTVSLEETPVHNFKIHQGQKKTFSLEITQDDGSAMVLTDYLCAMSIKDVAGGETFLTLTSSPAAGVTVTPASGLIEFVMTPAQTAAFTFNLAKYDILIYKSDGSEAKYLLRGDISLIPRITVV